MAQRTQIVLIDDLDGTEITDGNAQSITFRLAELQGPGRHQGGPRLGGIQRHRAVQPRPRSR